jgi:hypothetical protein
LSDANGAFIFPQNIGSIASTTSGTINALIPQNTIAGTHYRIRVVGTNPITIGSDNGVDITINAYPIPIITANGNTAICHGDSVILTSSYSANYLWNNFETTQNIIVTSTGYYFVITTGSNGCSSSSAMTIVSYLPNPVPVISANRSLILCTGDSVTLTSNSTLNYLWNTASTMQSITTSIPGNYFVSVTDSSGCRGLSANAVVMDIPPVPIITHSGTLLASSSATGNQWLMNNQIINGATNYIYTARVTGCYSLMVTDTNGCTSISDTVCLEIRGTGIQEINNNNAIALYPNPNNGSFTISNLHPARAGGIYDLRIRDITGRTIYSQRLADNTNQIYLPDNICNGIYFWELINNCGILANGKLGIMKN